MRGPGNGGSLDLVSVLATVVVLSALVGSPTGGFFVDVGPSSANTQQMSSFDGKLSEIGPATENSTTDETSVDVAEDTWEDFSHSNGSVDPVNNTLRIENPTADHDVSAVNLTVSYAQNDSGVNDLIDDSNSTASSLNISVFEYNGTDLVGSRITDENNNGAVDLDDATAANLSDLSGISANGNTTLKISIAGDASNNDNVAGGDGVDFTVSIELLINLSWRDSDVTSDNTIQYKG